MESLLWFYIQYFIEMRSCMGLDQINAFKHKKYLSNQHQLNRFWKFEPLGWTVTSGTVRISWSLDFCVIKNIPACFFILVLVK